MNNYIDQYGRYHNKPVTELNPIPTNNGWIYTAYAVKIGLPIDTYKLEYCADLCYQGDNVMYRSPGKATPPISRDEILGLVSLELVNSSHLEGWNFSPYPVPKFSFIKCIKQFWEQRNKDRNYYWQNNLDQIYRFAFSVPLVDRYFILRKNNEFNIFYWAIAKIDSIVGKSSGIRFLKYDDSLKAMQEEFPADHPINNI